MSAEGGPEPLVAAAFAARLLEGLEVSYLIGGSFASSFYGEPRSTNDVDIIADLSPVHVDQLLRRATPECYVSEDAARDAVTTGGSFNLVHLSTAVKIDLFVAGSDAFDRERLRQRSPVAIPLQDAGELRLFVDTPENTVLRKLEWYRRGGESSERQWRDVVAVLRAMARLDEAHLVLWAERLSVTDLLSRARQEASGAS